MRIEFIGMRIEVDDNGCFICKSHRAGHGGYAQIKGDYAHRYSYKECIGEIPEGMVVRHTCDNPLCINPKHLILGTHNDNVQDRVSRGRSAKGTFHGRAKLTESLVSEIKKSTLPYTKLATLFGVSLRCIQKIKNGETWKDVV